MNQSYEVQSHYKDETHDTRILCRKSNICKKNLNH